MRPISSTWLCFLASLLTILVTLPASGGDLEPPSYRYEALSTTSGWDFATRQNPRAILPDLAPFFDQTGDAQLPIQLTFPGTPISSRGVVFGDVKWSPDQGGSYFKGATSAVSGLTFFVPSWYEVSDLESGVFAQKIRVQVTYKGEEPKVDIKKLQGISGAVTTRRG